MFVLMLCDCIFRVQGLGMIRVLVQGFILQGNVLPSARSAPFLGPDRQKLNWVL